MQTRAERITDAAASLVSQYILELARQWCRHDMHTQGLYVFAMNIAANSMLHFRDLAALHGAALPELPALPAIEPARA